MAEIKPLRAWRYNQALFYTIDSLTSPLFDVVSEKQRTVLYQNPFNSIHLSVPEPPHAAVHAAARLDQWKKNKVILQDPLPALYVYFQYFTLGNAPEVFCRKGFVCNIRIYDWKEHVILRHENTLPKSVNDRCQLLEKTELNVSPTHGLYTDENFELESYLKEAITHPLYDMLDYQGTRNVVAVIHDARIIMRVMNVLNSKKIILADGHHRYEASLLYKKKKQKFNLHHTGQEGYNFHLMYLSNTEGNGITILPTHRLIKALTNFDEAAIVQKLTDDFIIELIGNADLLPEIIRHKPRAFGIIFQHHAYTVQLKPASFTTIPWPFPAEIKALDLTIMHYFIIEKTLGIPGSAQRESENLNFERSFSECLTNVQKGDCQMAIITNGVSMEEVKMVCRSGYTMPQKSTYFYPKVVCGFLFGSIQENEFRSPPHSIF